MFHITRPLFVTAVIALVIMTPMVSAAINTTIMFSDQNVTYSPASDWTINDPSHEFVAYSQVAGASFSILFTGTAVYFFSSQKSDRNTVQFSIDGSPAGSASENWPVVGFTTNANTTLWSREGLSIGSHTLVGTNAGDVNAPWISISGLIVTTSSSLSSSQISPSTSASATSSASSNTSTIIGAVAGATGAVVIFLLIGGLVICLRRRSRSQTIESRVGEPQHTEAALVDARPISALTITPFPPSPTPISAAYPNATPSGASSPFATPIHSASTSVTAAEGGYMPFAGSRMSANTASRYSHLLNSHWSNEHDLSAVGGGSGASAPAAEAWRDLAQGMVESSSNISEPGRVSAVSGAPIDGSTFSSYARLDARSGSSSASAGQEHGIGEMLEAQPPAYTTHEAEARTNSPLHLKI